MCEIVDRVCDGNKCVDQSTALMRVICLQLARVTHLTKLVRFQMLVHHQHCHRRLVRQQQANVSVGDVRLTQTDRELYESYGIGWQVMKQLASENEHDDIEDINFGADSKSEHDQRKLHADTAGIDPPTCSQCHFARWPARVSDNGR